jgi:hypothetical protein
MPLESHRHIKSVTTEIELRPDGTVKSVGILYTDLALSNLSPGYDANAVEELGCVDKFNPDADTGKQHEGGEALDQLVVAGRDAA